MSLSISLNPSTTALVIITDIFGLTDDIIDLALTLKNGHCATIVDPYQGVRQTFANEAQAYQRFIEQCGHDAYVDKIFSVIDSLSTKVKILSFSAGASAAFRLTERFSPGTIEHLIGFYPSQIRHHLGVNPNCPVTLIFPCEEDHFDVDKVIQSVSKSNAVQCIKTTWRHGFMNPQSDNYNDEAASVLGNIINKGIPMNITIRHSEPQDYVAIKEIYQQPSCYAGTLQLPYPSEDKWQQRLSKSSDNVYSLVAELDGKIVGQIGMEVFSSPRRKHVANIGMAVSENVQGQGVGSKLIAAMIDLANNWLAVTRIELEVYTDNTAGKALYEKHGFVLEGTAKGYAFRDGQYVDTYLMAKVS